MISKQKIEQQLKAVTAEYNNAYYRGVRWEIVAHRINHLTGWIAALEWVLEIRRD